MKHQCFDPSMHGNSRSGGMSAQSEIRKLAQDKYEGVTLDNVQKTIFDTKAGEYQTEKQAFLKTIATFLFYFTFGLIFILSTIEHKVFKTYAS